MRKMLISIAVMTGLSGAGNPVLAATNDTGRNASAAAGTANGVQNPAPGQVIALEGGQNFRDIGGYVALDRRRVKRGMIFRSADLHDLSERDHDQIARLGLRAVIDLRSTAERTARPTRWPSALVPTVAIDYVVDYAPLLQKLRDPAIDRQKVEDMMEEGTLALMDSQIDQQRALFAELLKPDADGALLYHCTAGKDRTGLATAIILAALGVDRQAILADYELSNLHYRMKAASDPIAARFPADVVQAFGRVEPRYLRAAFARIDSEYGGVEPYLERRLGVTPGDIAVLRARYTETDASLPL